MSSDAVPCVGEHFLSPAGQLMHLPAYRVNQLNIKSVASR